MIALSSKRRSELRAEAHKLNPLVIIGDKGLTDEVLAEIDRTLKAHELIKVRANTDAREARDQWLDTICERLNAHPVQQIGKIFVLYRENPDEPRAPKASAEKPPRRGGAVVSERGQARQRSRNEDKRRGRDVIDMVRKGKIKPKVAVEPAVRRDDEPAPRARQQRQAASAGDAPRAAARRTPSLPAPAPRRRRTRSS